MVKTRNGFGTGLIEFSLP